MSTYSEKLQDPRWQKKRLEILKRDKFKCQLCSDKKTTLHVHHLKYVKEPWMSENKDLQTLCKDCHGLIEHLKDNDNWELEYITSILKVDSIFYCLLSKTDYIIYTQCSISKKYSEFNLIIFDHINLIIKHKKQYGS